MIEIERLTEIRRRTMEAGPLIHCLTNHITINDCANMVLVVGGRPIMAEHPAEVQEITATAGSLAMNLGNITDERMKSMRLSAQTAAEQGIPSVFDIVGVACSRLRLDFAKELLKSQPVSVIKGNMSEMKALCGVANNARGIDAGEADAVRVDNQNLVIPMARELAKQYRAVIVITGAVDVITDGNDAWLMENGCRELSRVTGTGCMLNVLIGTYLAEKDALGAAVLGTAVMGIGGELAAKEAEGIGSFKVKLFDHIDTLTDKVLRDRIRIKKAGGVS